MTLKKKSTPGPKTTLHNFFNAQSDSSAKGVGRTLKLAKKAPPKQIPLPQDIIVIDSDSDDDPIEIVQNLQISSRKKRRRLSESSSEIEFIETPSLRRRTTGSINVVITSKDSEAHGGGSNSTMHYHPAPSISNVSHNSSMSDLKIPTNSTKPRASFGMPSLLLGGPPTTESGAGSNKTVSFGVPFLLRPHDTQRRHSAPRVSFLLGKEDGPVEVDQLTTADEEWGVGDDEKANDSQDDEDNFDEPKVKLPEALLEETSTADSDFPPQYSLCNPRVGGHLRPEIQNHMNECLDPVQPPTSSSSPTFTIITENTEITRSPSLSFSQAHGPLQLISCDGKTKPQSGNAFNMIMSSHKQNEAWKEASMAEDRKSRSIQANGNRRRAPFYKILQGMPIAVDAFRYGAIPGVTAYFLTHAHSDHYTNLSSAWKNGPIYCSQETANLIIHMLSVDSKWVYPLPMDIPTVIPNTNGVRVTLIEANHCPGSSLFYFEGPQTVHAGDSAFKSPWVGSPTIFKYLHCGDFRASPRHILHPEIRGKKIDHVYLDTTYLDPRYSFPPQPLVISACAELAQRLSTGQSHSRTSTVDSWLITKDCAVEKPQAKPKVPKSLFVVGTYSIGKERIVKAIARALKTKIYCDARKAAILQCQADPELNDLLTLNPLEASVHVVPLGLITSDKLGEYMKRFQGQFDKAIGFRPTGWTYTQPTGSDSLPSISSILSPSQHRDFTHANLRPSRNSTTTLQLYSVPYSEHSSFYELTCFAMSFEWGRMIPTVNVGTETSRGKISKWITKWEAEKKRKGKLEVVPYRHPDYW